MAMAFSLMPVRLRPAPNNIGVRSNMPGVSSHHMKVTTVSPNTAMPTRFENGPNGHHDRLTVSFVPFHSSPSRMTSRAHKDELSFGIAAVCNDAQLRLNAGDVSVFEVLGDKESKQGTATA